VTEKSRDSPQLPNGWVWTKLGEIAEVIRGASPRPKGDPRYFGGDIPWIMISDISKEEGKFISKTRDKVTAEGAKKSRYLKTGTLILSNSGTVCVPKILAVDGCIHDGFVAFPNLTGNLELLYLFYYFQHIRRQVINENRQGVTQVNLNTSIVREIAIPLPPFPEQGRIVGKVEELFSFLDTGLESLRKAKAQLKRYRQAVLKYAFEGKLTEEWRKTQKVLIEPASELLNCIFKNRRLKWNANHFAQMKDKGSMTSIDDRLAEKYKEPISPDTSDLPRLPEGWIWVTLDQLAWSVKDGPHYSPEYIDQGIPFITGGNIRPSGVDFDSAKRISPELHRKYSERCKPEVGDILYTKGGTTGVARVNTYNHEFSVWVHVAVLKLARPLEPFYVQHALNSPFCHEQAQRFTHGVGNQDLGLTRMIRIVLSLPPLAEQKEIVAKIDHLQSITDEVERIVETNLRYAEHLRQTILRDAFLGKLVPQDLNDEGADKLRECIKAERAKSKGEKDTNKGRKNKPKQSELPNYVK
jgi:type I restriction enzyme S subunit